VVDTPIAAGNPSSGVFSIACIDNKNLVAVGGDYKDPDRSTQVAAYSNNSGETWQLCQTQPTGYRSAVASFSNGDLAAVGPNGKDVSRNKGIHWQHADSLNLNAVRFDGREGWAVGPKGTIVRFNTQFFYEMQKSPTN
jgi:photosystem II stability/assembly factor-like uncharacterized protein